MPNLNEILNMLEDSMTSGIEKTASEKEDKAEVPAGSEQFTKTASAIKEAEELGAKVATQLLKQAEDEKKEESKDEKKEESKDEGDKETKDEAKEEGESEEEEAKEKSKEEDMDKKANLVDIISAMLEKSAFEGDENTQNGVPGGVVPNKMQVDNAANVAYQDATIGVTPGTNGNNDGGTVNQIMDAIVAKAQGAGGIGENQVPGGTPFSGAEAQDPNVEKTAAVVALVESGVDFDTAVDLVKQAEYEINEEVMNIEKKAAFDALIEEGVDFDTATDLVKEAAGKAGLVDKARKAYTSFATKANSKIQKATGASSWKGLGSKISDKAQSAAVGPKARLADEAADLKTSIKALRTGKLESGDFYAQRGLKKGYQGQHLDKDVSGISRMSTLGHIARNRIAQGVAGTGAAAGAGAAYYAHQKKAAFDALVEEGVDFDTATDLVKQASIEVFGE